MRVIVDSNRIISALIKEGVSRKILSSKNIEFFTVDYVIKEINKYKAVFSTIGLLMFQYAVKFTQSLRIIKSNILVVPFLTIFTKSVISREYNLMLSE